jgi:glycosyltransferase 2 family protein
MLRAIAKPADAAMVFASFVVASMVATLAWVPGGLGTFEGTCVAMLHVHGAAIEAARAATLLARGFTFWLPMAPGLTIARRVMMRGTARAGPTPAAETP